MRRKPINVSNYSPKGGHGSLRLYSSNGVADGILAENLAAVHIDSLGQMNTISSGQMNTISSSGRSLACNKGLELQKTTLSPQPDLEKKIWQQFIMAVVTQANGPFTSPGSEIISVYIWYQQYT